MSDNPEINVDGDVGRDVSNNVVAGRDVNIILPNPSSRSKISIRLTIRRAP